MHETLNDETLQMFVEDAEKELAHAEKCLLQIQESGKTIDQNLQENILRPIHSIKTGAVFIGLKNIKELAHKIEIILDMILRNEIVPDKGVIDVLFNAFGCLKDLCLNVSQSEQVDISDNLLVLRELACRHLTGEEQKTLEKDVQVPLPSAQDHFVVSRFDLRQGIKSGKSLYCVQCDLIYDVHRRHKTPMDMLKDLQQCGKIIDIKLDLFAAGSLEDEQIIPKLPMFVLLSTSQRSDLISKNLGLRVEAVQQIKIN